MKKIIGAMMGMLMIISAFTAMFGFTSAAENQLPEPMADPTLVADIQMNDGSGQYAQDSSSYNNDATLGDSAGVQSCDPAWSQGAFGGALSFDGDDDILTLPDTPSLHLTAQTIEFWVEVPTGGDECSLFTEEFELNTTRNEVGKMYSDGRLQYIFNQGSYFADTGIGLPLSGWVHIAFTRTGSPSGTARIYLNGVEKASVAYYGHELDSSKPLNIGGPDTSSNPPNHMQGKMDKLRVWSRALSAAEIVESYNQIYSPFRIDKNADFSSYASSGTGFESDPWIIENKTINGIGKGYGIYIGNTSQYFILRNCIVENATGGLDALYYPNAGLTLYNVTKGTILNCTFRDNAFAGASLNFNVRRNIFNDSFFVNNSGEGIEIWDANNNEFNRIEVRDNYLSGILLLKSPNNVVAYSNISNNGGNGITLNNASNNNHILNNSVNFNGGIGIEIGHNATNGSIVNEVLGNEINNNSFHGIAIFGDPELLTQTQNNTVGYNTISGNVMDGIRLDGPIDSQIYNNTISLNSNWGMNITSGSGNSIYHNRFINNNIQAREIGTGNIWDDGYPSGGNYWSDYGGIDLKSGPLQNLAGSDGIGDTQYTIDADSIDQYPLWFPVEVNKIQIMDGPNGTGSIAPDDIYTYPGFNLPLWAAGYNTTLGCYVRDVSVNWTNSNHSGAASNITNLTGYSTTWQAGPNLGYALLEANYTTGMTDEVNLTIPTYLPDIMIDGKTDDVYENPPTTQKSWKNMTQGGSASYDIIAENDGSTPGAFTLVWVVSGLPGTFYAVMLNDDLHTNVTSLMSTGVTFDLNPGGQMNFTLYINSSTTAGFGQTKTVNIGLFPPSGMQDSAGAIAQVYSPDYIALTSTPGGTNITTSTLLVGQQVTAYASAYNISGLYLGIVPVDWSDLPDLGAFDNATGTSSTFTAVALGNGNITGTSTGLGLNDSFAVQITTPADTILPVSSVSATAMYWLNASSQELEASATDADSGVANVTLWFRFSANNNTWVGWTAFSTDTTLPWSWTFTFPNASGYYQFYSIAVDIASNVETAPATADVSCAYDSLKPTIQDNSAMTATTGESFTIAAVVSDNMALHGVHLIYWFGTGTELNVTMTGTGNTKTYLLPVPLNILDVLHYRIAAVDRARNWNLSAIKSVIVSDNDAPIADAGADQIVDAGTQVTFNGTGSTDNIGIANYTWTFIYSDVNITLWGVQPTFTFVEVGAHTITLLVSDAAGLNDTDGILITVNSVNLPPVADAGTDTTGESGLAVTFNGAGSTDDVGVTNYTWTFTYNGTLVTLFGVAPQFTFWTAGIYDITLTVRDADGLSDTDTLQITINSPTIDDDQGGPSEYCWIIFIIIIVMAILLLLAILKNRKKGKITEKSDDVDEKSDEDGGNKNEQNNNNPPNSTQEAL